MEEKSKEELIDIGKLPNVKILAGSHNKITIEKLYGPACVPDLTIIWDGNDWNVRTKNKELRELLRGDKMKKQTTEIINPIICENCKRELQPDDILINVEFGKIIRICNYCKHGEYV